MTTLKITIASALLGLMLTGCTHNSTPDDGTTYGSRSGVNMADSMNNSMSTDSMGGTDNTRTMPGSNTDTDNPAPKQADGTQSPAGSPR